eukprot:scaffold366158_cov33-Prasinocladus_malaysianus.AAC.1
MLLGRSKKKSHRKVVTRMPNNFGIVTFQGVPSKILLRSSQSTNWQLLNTAVNRLVAWSHVRPCNGTISGVCKPNQLELRADFGVFTIDA